MFKKWIVATSLLLLLISCSNKSTSPDNRTLLEKLEDIPGAVIVEVQSPDGFQSAYQIDLPQPVDHNSPNGFQFNRRFLLYHRSETAPMVMAISGYSLQNSVREESELLQANQIQVGCRLMPGAEIDPVDYTLMNFEQISADFHQIIEVLKPIYTGKWVSRGTSKGGMCALLHKRYYPNDVDAVIALVAPLPTAPEDPRFNTFLTEEIATPACREKMEQFQRAVLLHKQELLPMMNEALDTFSQSTISFDAETILEYAVLEYPFSFWQIGPGDCNVIPDNDASVQELFDALTDEVGLLYYSDAYLNYYYPIYYHALTETGYYGFVTDHLDDLLTTDDHYSNDIFAPPGVDLTFNTGVMPSAINWLQNQGNNIIYIYGENDPWTAAAIALNGSARALKIVQTGENHGVTIFGLDNAQEVYDSLESWLDVPVYPQAVPVMMKTAPEEQQRRGLF